MSAAPQLLLASASPRRAELLRQLGLQFTICPADIIEAVAPGETAAAYAQRIAREKAQAGWDASDQRLPVLGADTDVVLDGRVLGKPRDGDDAQAMLLALADRSHEVYSAVALVDARGVRVALSVTTVSFGPISAAQARAYWASGEPQGKAGAYAIQGFGAMFVREIRGSYSGVVGLPLYETCALLEQSGIRPLPSARP